MASAPNPEPDYGPIDNPEPSSPPSELPPLPGDIDQPAPISEPGPTAPGFVG